MAGKDDRRFFMIKQTLQLILVSIFVGTIISGCEQEMTPSTTIEKARLIDEDMTVDFYEVTTPNDIVTVIATQPLTINEEWNIMPRNSFITLHNGLPQKQN